MDNLSISGHFWFRESTQEWVFEVNLRIPDVITRTARYTGATRRDALVKFQTLFPEALNDDLNYVLNDCETVIDEH